MGISRRINIPNVNGLLDSINIEIMDRNKIEITVANGLSPLGGVKEETSIYLDRGMLEYIRDSLDYFLNIINTENKLEE